MAKRKPEEAKGGAPEWMATFSDLVTLLMCFFVLLFAMSNVDEEKFSSLAEAFSGQPISVIDFGGGNGVSKLLGGGIMDLPRLDNSINETMEKFKEIQEKLGKAESEWKTYFAENEALKDVEIFTSQGQIRMILPEGILFESGRANLNAASYEPLKLIGSEMLKYPDAEIIIEGHTDNRPISTAQFPSNWHLSSARAMAVRDYLEYTEGIPPERTTAQAKGEYSPIADNSTPEGRQRNRRVEIILNLETENR